MNVLLIGAGAIGRVVLRELAAHPVLRIAGVIARPGSASGLQTEFGSGIRVITSVAAIDSLDTRPDYVLECAGHGGVKEHVAALLRRGIDCALLSVGSLAEPGLPETLEAAARDGGSQLTLVAGAIAGIDAISAARFAGLDEVSYTGRKPPLGWLGSPAEDKADLRKLDSELIIFEGTARDAARLFPKNANVAATVSLAGLGLDRTRVTLIADPATSKNVHQVTARGAFGELDLTISGRPLPDNPKTSALAAWSAVRTLHNLVASVVV